MLFMFAFQTSVLCNHTHTHTLTLHTVDSTVNIDHDSSFCGGLFNRKVHWNWIQPKTIEIILRFHKVNKVCLSQFQIIFCCEPSLYHHHQVYECTFAKSQWLLWNAPNFLHEKLYSIFLLSFHKNNDFFHVSHFVRNGRKNCGMFMTWTKKNESSKEFNIKLHEHWLILPLWS